MEYRINSTTELDIQSFLRFNYKLFAPEYEEICESTKYYHKLYLYSTRFEIWDNERLIGLLCTYFNQENRFAYVPYLCIKTEYSGKGLATQLLNKLIDMCSLKNILI